MLKKKLNISLLLLLVVLFISLLGTTCYAYSYTFTTEDCDKIIERFATSSYQSGFKSRIWNRVNALQQQYDIVAIDFDHYSYYDYFYIYGFNTSQVTAVSNGGNLNYMGVTLSSAGYRYQVSYGNSWTNSGMSWSGGQFGTGSQQRTKYLAINNDIGSFFSGPWQSSEVLTFSPSDYYTFVPNIALSSIIINGDSVPYYNFNNNSADSFVLGQLALYKNYAYSELFEYRYQNGWKLTNIYKLNKLGTISNDIMSVRFYGSALENDTLYSLMMYSKYDSDFPHIAQPFYIGSRYTKINNGVLDIDNTFSGDYYNNYNNDTNTDKIINNINSGDNIDNILNENLSGDVISFTTDLGFTMFDNPFTTFLIYVVDGVYDTLTEREDIILTANYRNYLTFELNSADFVTPNSPIKTFISMMLVTIYIYGNYKFFYHLIVLLQTARIKEFIAKVGTDEFYDTDIM